MKFENIRVMNFQNALRGMRNPKESYHLSDTLCGLSTNNRIYEKIATVAEKYVERDIKKGYPTSENAVDFYVEELRDNGILYQDEDLMEYALIGPKDMELAQSLIRGGSEHRKFMRQIFVSVDITAPLYWWKEFDTYKVATVANSTSTMHTITEKPITIDSFEIDDFFNIPFPEDAQRDDLKYPVDGDVVQMVIIPYLEYLRQEYLKLKEDIKDPSMFPAHEREEAQVRLKKIWKELIRWLPESWLQTRTVTMNYENLLGMCSKGQRRYHKLNEWSGIDDNTLEHFIKFARSLPYAKNFIFIDEHLT